MVEVFRHCRHIGYSFQVVSPPKFFLYCLSLHSSCVFEPLGTLKAGVAAAVAIVTVFHYHQNFMLGSPCTSNYAGRFIMFSFSFYPDG
jgi:predicted membrane protein